MATEILFHSSFDGNIRDFWDLTHFGTREAATDNLRRKGRESKIREEGYSLAYIYECEVENLDRVVEIEDQKWPSPVTIINALADQRLIAPAKSKEDNYFAIWDLRNKVNNLRPIDAPSYKASRRLIRQFLEGLEIDALEYKNSAEDFGSRSIILMNGGNARIRSKATMGFPLSSFI